VYDRKAEWIWGVLDELGPWAWVTAKSHVWGKNKPESQKEANRAHVRPRSPEKGERQAQGLADSPQAPLPPSAQVGSPGQLRIAYCIPLRHKQDAKGAPGWASRAGEFGQKVLLLPGCRRARPT
jgi:hypothetical protein